jgi:hypothetical protein
MAKQTYIDSPYKTFPAAVPANLVGLEGYAVELIPGTNTIQLYTATAGRPLLGFLYERLEGDVNWVVRLPGKGGTLRAVCADGTIGQAPCWVKAVAGGGVSAAGIGANAVGFKISPAGPDAAGDVIEIMDELTVAY